MQERDTENFLDSDWDYAPSDETYLPLVVLVPGRENPTGLIEFLQDRFVLETDYAVQNDFNIDEYLDYRATRPKVQVQDGRIMSIDVPDISLSLAKDSLGNEFYLLRLPEPDYSWVKLSIIIADRILAEFNISHVTFIEELAMPVPHTRPVQYCGLTDREDLQDVPQHWSEDSPFKGGFIHSLAFAFSHFGCEYALWTVFVPSYISNTYPPAQLKALSLISESTGLVFDTEDVIEMCDDLMENLAKALPKSGPVVEVIKEYEKRLDAYLEHQKKLSELPNADEIAAEFQQYLIGSNADFGIFGDDLKDKFDSGVSGDSEESETDSKGTENT